MKKNLSPFSITYLILAFGCLLSLKGFAQADQWERKANFTGDMRQGAVTFSIAGKGYIGAGWDNYYGVYYKDLWEYDPATDVWTQKADLTGLPREEAVGFSVGDKGYIGTGLYYDYNGDGYATYLNDFWSYDPVSNTWNQQANFPGTARYMAVGFGMGSKGYIGTGYQDGYYLKNDFWEYDPATDSWSSKPNVPGSERMQAVGFSIGAKCYIGLGMGYDVLLSDFYEYDPAVGFWIEKQNFYTGNPEGGFSIGNKGYLGPAENFWEYDPVTDLWANKNVSAGGPGAFVARMAIGNKGYIINASKEVWEFTPGVQESKKWIAKASFTGGTRNYPVSFAIGDKGYLGTGTDYTADKNDFWEYDASTDVWTQKANVGGEGRYAAVGFSIGNRGYIGTGKGDSGDKKDFWAYDPAANKWTRKKDLPGTERSWAVGISMAGRGYIGTGYHYLDNADPSAYYLGDFWEYNPATDEWSFITPFPGRARSGATGFSLNSYGYIGSGSVYRAAAYDFWRYDPATTRWSRAADFMGAVGPAFTVGNKAYMGSFNHFWVYDPNQAASGWVQLEPIPGKGITTGFGIGNNAFVYTGENSNNFWQYPTGQKLPPLVITKDVTLYLDANGSAIITPAMVNNGSIGYCGNLTYALDKTVFTCADKGINNVTLTVNDCNGSSTGTALVTVKDKQKPVLTGINAAPNTLWPPNHKMKLVTINYVAADNCGIAGTALSVSSNQFSGGQPDWVILDEHHVYLRAERTGHSRERLYTIAITVKDAAGNTSRQTVDVKVKNQRRHCISGKYGDEDGADDSYRELDAVVSPNPSTNYFTLQVYGDEEQPVHLSVNNVLGKRVEVKNNIPANSTIILGNDYQPGIYFVQLQQGYQQVTLKLVKLKRGW